uniref:Uncharacterized protein n=1 Tax=Sinocyclocheilus anshuiensis TaxID=1608454 RepID=A0A671QU89_9TELE
MAEAILEDHDQYSCSICLDLLRDPVTIPCGHSYCMGCIGECWNTNDLNGIYRCPQCRQAFNSKPPLNRSTVLAEIMEKLRSTELQVCSICLDLLRDPVTIPCGHSYCMGCIGECWNTNDLNGVYRCPQCRQAFNSKPPLNRSTVLAEIMEKLRSTELQVSESAQCLAGPGEIACDFCAGEMIKAVKSCLECRASYCETHVQPHYNVPALKKHKLVKAAVIPVCPKHDKLLEVYCRTDQKCVCMHCLLDDHKGHDTVPSTIERNEKQVKMSIIFFPLMTQLNLITKCY